MSINVNEKIECFNSVLLSFLNHHAPLLPYKKQLSSIKAWFTNEIKRAIIKIDLAYAAFKNGLVPRLHHTQLRNVATAVIKPTKMNYLKPKLDSKLGSKVIWQNLRDVVSQNNVKPTLTADKYNKHLASCASTTAQRPVPRTSNSNERAFAFKNVTCTDVGRVIQSIKSQAIGLHNIPIVFVKFTLAFTLPVLTHIINLTSSNIPKCWKLAKVIPNHKKTRSRGLDAVPSFDLQRFGHF